MASYRRRTDNLQQLKAVQIFGTGLADISGLVVRHDATIQNSLMVDNLADVSGLVVRHDATIQGSLTVDNLADVSGLVVRHDATIDGSLTLRGACPSIYGDFTNMELKWIVQSPAFNAAGNNANPTQPGVGYTFRVKGIAIDTSGNTYVAYSTNGVVPGGTNAGGYDVAIVAFNTAGTLIWITESTLINTLTDDLWPSLVVCGDYLYMTVSHDVTGLVAYNLCKINKTNGTVYWVNNYTDQLISDIVCDPSGIWLLVKDAFQFSNSLKYYDLSGVEQYNKLIIDVHISTLAQNNSSVFIAGSPIYAGGNYMIVIQCDKRTGDQINYIDDGRINSGNLSSTCVRRPFVAVGPDGNPVVIYFTTDDTPAGNWSGTSVDMIMFKLSAVDFSVLWIIRFPTGWDDYNLDTLSSVIGSSLTIDSNGYSYAMYTTKNGADDDLRITVVDNNGTIIRTLAPPFANTPSLEYMPMITLDPVTDDICIAYRTEGTVSGGTKTGSGDLAVARYVKINGFALQPSGGYVGVGTCNPQYTLDVRGTLGTSKLTVISNSTDPNGILEVDAANGTVDIYPAEGINPTQFANIGIHSGQIQLNLQVETDPFTSISTANIGIADPSGTWLAPVVTFDSSANRITIINNTGAEIVLLDQAGNLTINGNVDVKGDGNNTGTVKTDFISLYEQNDNSKEANLWNQSDLLLWENNAGDVEQISGWNAILDPSGLNILPIIPAACAVIDPDISNNIVGTLTCVVESLNILLMRLSSRNAFITSNDPTPMIVFNTPLSIKFTSGTTTLTVTQPDGTISLLDLILAINAQLISFPIQFSLNTRTNVAVLSNFSTNTYKIVDVSDGSAFLFMNHMNFSINAPTTYIGRSFSIGLQGTPVDISNGNLTVPTGTPTISVASRTATSITVTLGAGTSIDKTHYALTRGGITRAVIASTRTSYRFTGLTVGPTYVLGVTPLSRFDAGPIATISYTITPVTVDVYNSGSTYFSATPYTSGFNREFLNIVGTMNTAIWTGPGPLATLININQIQSITLRYYSALNASGVSDARFGTITGTVISTIFYTYFTRITPTKNGDAVAIGSTATGTNGTFPAGPVTIPFNAGLYTAIFNADTNGVINRTIPHQFYWTCGYASNTINNCDITQFSITYI